VALVEINASFRVEKHSHCSSARIALSLRPDFHFAAHFFAVDQRHFAASVNLRLQVRGVFSHPHL
jgi:hypothetical protein